MSITDLNALTESCSIEARKLPAAPALLGALVQTARIRTGWCSTGLHHIVDSTKLLDATLHGSLQVVELSNIDGTDANDLGAGTRGGNVLSHCLGLLYVATDDARVGSEVNQGTNLSTADCASTACAEDDLVGWKKGQLV